LRRSISNTPARERRNALRLLRPTALLQVDYMFVGIVVIGILGLISAVAFQEIERKAIPWKES